MKNYFLIVILTFNFSCSNISNKQIIKDKTNITQAKVVNPIKQNLIKIDSVIDTNKYLYKNFTLTESDTLWGYKDKNNRTVVNNTFFYLTQDTLIYYSIGLDTNFNMLAIDNLGEIIYKVFIFDQGPDYSSQGLFRFILNDSIGFADSLTGKIVIEPKFTYAEPFSEGVAVFCNGCIKEKLSNEHWTMIGGKWGYINNRGEKIFNMTFDRATSFIDGTASVVIDEKEYSIDYNGNLIPL